MFHVLRFTFHEINLTKFNLHNNVYSAHPPSLTELRRDKQANGLSDSKTLCGGMSKMLDKKLESIIRGVLPFDVLDGDTAITRMALLMVMNDLRSQGCKVDEFAPDHLLIRKNEEEIKIFLVLSK